MSAKTKSTLSTKRILITLLIIFLIPAVERILNIWVQNETLSYTFAFNAAGSALIFYDWNLFGVHYNRSKSNLPVTIIYSIIGILGLLGWVWVGQNFLKAHLLLPDPETIAAYPFAEPAVLIAYSFMQAAVVNIGFKCATDHLSIRTREVLVILISGLLFGGIYTLLFTPLQTVLWITTYLYNVIMIMFLSYLYNQSSSFMPGIISLGTVMLITEILMLA